MSKKCNDHFICISITLENEKSFHACLDILSSYLLNLFIIFSHLLLGFIFLTNLMLSLLRAYNLPLPGVGEGGHWKQLNVRQQGNGQITHGPAMPQNARLEKNDLDLFLLTCWDPLSVKNASCR